MTHVTTNNLLSPRQHGFVNRRSCCTNLLMCQDIASKALHEGNPIDILYTDFSKAFDKVNQKKPIDKTKGLWY